MDKQKQKLTDEIAQLIRKRQEGGYWDFKKQWHNNSTDLLHDIICMANNLQGRDAYIIIGVDDVSHEIIGVDGSDKNRKNTNEIKNLLIGDQKFFGDIRPMVYVENIHIDGKVLDVLVIEKSFDVPFILKNDFPKRAKARDDNEGSSKERFLKKYHVYTRVNDSNTPIDKSADPDKVDLLYKRRFRVNESAWDKALYYLSHPDDWLDTKEESKDKYYYKYAPEYSVEFTDEKILGRDFLTLLFPNPDGKKYEVVVKVHDIVVYKGFYSLYDGARCKMISPKYDCVVFDPDSNQEDYIHMFYVIEDSFEYRLMKFLIARMSDHDKSRYLSVWEKYVLVLESDYELDDFKKYLKGRYGSKDVRGGLDRCLKLNLSEDIPEIDQGTMKLLESEHQSAQFVKEEYQAWRDSRHASL